MTLRIPSFSKVNVGIPPPVFAPRVTFWPKVPVLATDRVPPALPVMVNEGVRVTKWVIAARLHVLSIVASV